MRKVNVLGFNEYVKQAHPKEYDRNLLEYQNYSNWLDPKFLKLGHVYKTSSPFKNPYVYVLDGFQPIINDSYKLTYTYLVHFSSYKEYNDDGCGWVSLDDAYKMMLVDITGTKDAFGNVIKKEDVKVMPRCNYTYHILNKDKKNMEVLVARFEHRSYIDYSYSNKKHYNRHICGLEYKKYDYVMEDGEWTKEYSTSWNKIRLAADNTMGWCHDTDSRAFNSRYDGRMDNLRSCKMKYLGVKSLAKYPMLFDDINTLSTDMFVPYPIKSTEW